MTISYSAHNELIDLIEDSVEYFCDQNMISGELAYTILECYAIAKIAQFQKNVI